MAAQGVEGQGWVGGRQIPDLAIGQESQLNQGLEAVADPQHQPVPMTEEVGQGVGQTGIPEGGGDEFARTVRLVTARKTSRQHDDLSTANRRLHPPDGFLDRRGGQVPDHQHLRLGARPLESAGGIVFTVGAGEDRDENPRLRGFHSGCAGLPRPVQRYVHRHGGVPGRPVGEYGFQRPHPGFRQAVELHFFPIQDDFRTVDRGADEGILDAFEAHVPFPKFQHQRTRQRGEQGAAVHIVIESEADPVAEAHLCHSCGHAAFSHHRRSVDHAETHQLCHLVEKLTGLFPAGQPGLFIHRQGQKRHERAGLPEGGGTGSGRFGHGKRKADQRGGHIQVIKAARHRILPADGGDPHLLLG